MHYSAQPQQYGIRYRVELIRDIMETQHADKLSFVLQDLIPLLTMNGVKVEQWKTRKIVKDVWRLTPAHNAPAYLAYQCYYTKPRAILADMIYAMLKCGIDAIIHFGTDKYKSIFGNYEAADIKSVMLNYGGSKEQQQAIERWLCDYADRRQTFDKTSTDL